MDILKRLIEDDDDKPYIAAVEEKWGKFPYEKTSVPKQAKASPSFRISTNGNVFPPVLRGSS